MRLGQAIVCSFAVGITALACAPDKAERPQCPTHGAPTLAFGAYARSALPSGKCDSDETCELPVVNCDAPGAMGPIDDFECSCTDGAWKCHIRVQGGAMCLPSDWKPQAPQGFGVDASATDAGKPD